ncbi:MAG: 2TM domain-containing protein [Promethearchaeota archaeon]
MSINSGFSEESLRKIAAQKVRFRVSVKIHLTMFIVVNILLLIVNFLITPDLYWIIFPFFSWLIGFAMHVLAYSLYAKGVYPMAKRGAIYHLTSFIFVTIFLFIINLTTFPKFYWVIFPAIFWGVVVILHILLYIHYFRGGFESTGRWKSIKERAIEKELEKMRKKQKKNNLGKNQNVVK